MAHLSGRNNPSAVVSRNGDLFQGMHGAFFQGWQRLCRQNVLLDAYVNGEPLFGVCACVPFAAPYCGKRSCSQSSLGSLSYLSHQSR